MNREIVIWPDSMLKRVCEPVAKVDNDVRRLLADMEHTMLTANGAGLAAPQVGFALRAVVLKVEKRDELERPLGFHVLKLVNPVILERHEERISVDEGCLSLPGVRVPTKRAKWVRVKALDETGEPVEVAGDGMLAVALQHELEHLEGVMITDQLSTLKRDMLAKKFKKAKQAGMRYVFPQPEPQDFTAAASKE